MNHVHFNQTGFWLEGRVRDRVSNDNDKQGEKKKRIRVRVLIGRCTVGVRFRYGNFRDARRCAGEIGVSRPSHGDVGCLRSSLHLG